MHIDGQQVGAFGIVAVAAAVVGRRMFGQIAGFWDTKKSAGCGGCDGCGPSKTASPISTSRAETKPATPNLVQLQMRPPIRIKRPPSQKA